MIIEIKKSRLSAKELRGRVEFGQGENLCQLYQTEKNTHPCSLALFSSKVLLSAHKHLLNGIRNLRGQKITEEKGHNHSMCPST